MVVKVYVSGISGNKEVKKRQQRVLMILDSKIIKYEVVDIAEPGNDELKDFMQNNSTSKGCTVSDPDPRHPLPPQIFNDESYCGDYDQFDMANEIDELEKFLKLAPGESTNGTILQKVEIQAPPEESAKEESNESSKQQNDESAKQENDESAKQEDNESAKDNTEEVPENPDGDQPATNGKKEGSIEKEEAEDEEEGENEA